jgi:hypothetical protein
MEEVSLQPLLLSKAPFKTWLGELPPEDVPRLDTAGVVDDLVNMFPQVERAVVEAVAESSGNSLESALEALLAISSSEPAAGVSMDGQTAEERQIKDDEMLALQLFQQFAAEERSRAGSSGGAGAIGADRMFDAISQEGSAAHAQFQQRGYERRCSSSSRGCASGRPPPASKVTRPPTRPAPRPVPGPALAAVTTARTAHKEIERSPWVLCILPGRRLFETSVRSGKACA